MHPAHCTLHTISAAAILRQLFRSSGEEGLVGSRTGRKDLDKKDIDTVSRVGTVECERNEGLWSREKNALGKISAGIFDTRRALLNSMAGYGF